MENGQIVMRYPTLPEGAPPRAISIALPDVRTGKNSLWMPYEREENWQARLCEVLEKLNS
jgi:hypothetical protein